MSPQLVRIGREGAKVNLLLKQKRKGVREGDREEEGREERSWEMDTQAPLYNPLFLSMLS
jgi:hypothetical protein